MWLPVVGLHTLWGLLEGHPAQHLDWVQASAHYCRATYGESTSVTLLTRQNPRNHSWASSFAEGKKLALKDARASAVSHLLWFASINVLILMVLQELGADRIHIILTASCRVELGKR